MGENTFFLSLTFPDMAPQAELLGKLAVGTDAMELRVVSSLLLLILLTQLLVTLFPIVV
jgi:hypothetical protein